MTKNQTSVSFSRVEGIEGSIANKGNNDYVRSMVAEEVLKPGRFVKLGTDQNIQVKKLNASGDVALGSLVGMTAYDRSRPMPCLQEDNTGGEGITDFEVNTGVAVVKNGSFFMIPETAMNVSTPVYIRYAAKSQVQTLVFSAALITANVINGKIGGNAISPVTFATDNATTLTAIATAIKTANSSVFSAVSDGTDTITVTTVIDASDQDLSDWVVTLGATQATAAIFETVLSVNSSNIGRIRNDADSSTAALAPTNTVRVENNVVANAIVSVSININ